MDNKRTFDLKTVDTDDFLELPISAQNLYFHLGTRADNNCLVSNPKKITRMVGGTQDDMKLLIDKKYVALTEKGIVVVMNPEVRKELENGR